MDFIQTIAILNDIEAEIKAKAQQQTNSEADSAPKPTPKSNSKKKPKKVQTTPDEVLAAEKYARERKERNAQKSENKAAEQDCRKESIFNVLDEEFDLRKAVIYSEILTPKFLDHE